MLGSRSESSIKAINQFSTCKFMQCVSPSKVFRMYKNGANNLFISRAVKRPEQINGANGLHQRENENLIFIEIFQVGSASRI